jgi:hypothetical protein
LAVRTAHDVPVNLERRACIGVTKLALSDFGAGTGVEQERRVRMAECMESTPRDPERVEKSPQVVFHDFVGGWRSTIARDKEKILWVWFPLRPTFL